MARKKEIGDLEKLVAKFSRNPATRERLRAMAYDVMKLVELFDNYCARAGSTLFEEPDWAQTIPALLGPMSNQAAREGVQEYVATRVAKLGILKEPEEA